MKTLQDYTTDELKAELKRRQIEARKQKSRKTEYAYATATVRSIDKYASFKRYYHVFISEDDTQRDRIADHRILIDVSLDVKIKAADKPKVGDVVKLRSRKTKDNPTGFGSFAHPIICEVLERNNKG